MIVAVVIVALLLFTGGSSYTVKAIFVNAGQLVKGNQVEVSGLSIGSISDIRLTADGQAEVVMSLDHFTPLHEGTTATIRASSLSGVANRYIALTLGPNSAPKIPDNGRIPADRTTAPVDLDQLFNSLDPATRKGLQDVIQGSAVQYAGKAAQANKSLLYLNPALTTSSAVTRELVSDRVLFSKFVSDSASVVSDLAARQADLSQLVGNANATTAAIASENTALNQSLVLLPTTLRKANSTFVNLRATLGDLDVLVAASKPATKDLAPFLAQLRPLVAEATPTIHDLALLIHQPGPGNDATDLTRQLPALASQTDTVFPRTVQALQKAQPVIEYARPYAPDLTGWFTKFGEGANTYDANGHYARIQPIFNAFQFTSTPAGPELVYTGGSNRLGGFQTKQTQRCPGGAMQPPPDGSAPYKDTPNFACDPSTVPPGQ